MLKAYEDQLTNARELLTLPVKSIIKHGHTTRGGKLHEIVHIAILRANSWTVFEPMPDGSMTDMFACKDRLRRLINIKQSCNFGNAADGTVKAMCEFRHSDYNVAGVSLSDIPDIEVVIGSLTTEYERSYQINGVTVHLLWGGAFADSFGIDPHKKTYDLKLVFDEIKQTYPVPFSYYQDKAIKETVERLYQELMAVREFRGVVIVDNHDHIMLDALDRARLNHRKQVRRRRVETPGQTVLALEPA
jgi:hypothetical protein